MNLKTFIDETLTPGAEVSSITWILQQYSMVTLIEKIYSGVNNKPFENI